MEVTVDERLGPEELLGVFAEMNVNSFGRAMVYLMNIPEDVKREAVRLVAPITRVEEGFFPKNVFMDQMCACNMNNANWNYTVLML